MQETEAKRGERYRAYPYRIDETPGREQPFTLWERDRVVHFFTTYEEALADVGKRRKVLGS